QGRAGSPPSARRVRPWRRTRPRTGRSRTAGQCRSNPTRLPLPGRRPQLRAGWSHSAVGARPNLAAKRRGAVITCPMPVEVARDGDEQIPLPRGRWAGAHGHRPTEFTRSPDRAGMGGLGAALPGDAEPIAAAVERAWLGLDGAGVVDHRELVIG